MPPKLFVISPDKTSRRNVQTRFTLNSLCTYDRQSLSRSFLSSGSNALKALKMVVAELPLEIWEHILGYCDHKTQYSLRGTSKSWKHHIERRIIPDNLDRGNYRVPDVSILLFNGFHQYRNNQALVYAGTQADVYHPYKESIEDYALFRIVDPLRYFKLNRMEDVDDMYLLRDCTDVVIEDCALKEAVVIRKQQLRKQGLIGPDEQSLMLPYNLLWRDDWEIQVPVQTEPFVDGVAVSIYGMGTPDQTWSTTFSSGANLPY